MNYSSRLFFFLFFLVSFSLDAQQLITSLSVDKGLPQTTVTALYRDNEGYLWCGTGRGLGLFNGWEFEQPQASTEKEMPAINTAIRGIVASSDQKTVWVGTETVCYQYDRFSTKPLRSFDVVKALGCAETPLIANDTALWLACSGRGLFRVRIQDGKTTQLTSTGYSTCCAALFDKRTIVVPDSLGRLVIHDVASGKTDFIPLPKELPVTQLRAFHELPGRSTSFLILSRNGLWQYDIEKKKFMRYSLGDRTYADTTFDFTSMDIHPDGSWWLSVFGQGVFRYDSQKHELRPCLWQQDGTYAGKLLLAVAFVVCDEYGVVWCATDGAGVVKLLHNRIEFHGKYNDGLVTDTCTWFTRCFYELSKDRYLVATYQHGIKLVDHIANTITTVSTDPLFNGVNALCFADAGNGRLLVGTDQNCLLLDTLNWKASVVQNGSGYRYIGAFTTGSKTYIYGNFGIKEFLDGIQPALSDDVGFDGVVTCAQTLKDGKILIATLFKGLTLYDQNLNIIRHYNYETEVGVPQTANVRAIFQDHRDSIWLGLESGLFKLDANFHVTQQFTTADGLPDNVVYDAIRFSDREVLLATGNGVSVFDFEKFTFQSYSSADGLPSAECNSGGLYYASSYFYIATTSGFVRWQPKLSTNCYRKSILLASYGPNEEARGVIRESIVRDYGSGSIELMIWQTDFAFPERVMFYYKLDGSGDEELWELGLRKVNYAALGSGFYSFLCSTHVPGCERTEITKLLTIKVVPPFWMSGWFIAITSLGAVLIITLVLFIIMRMNYQRKLRKLKMQQELDKVRARISRDIHDDIGAGLTRIALSGELMAHKSSEDLQQQEKLKWIAGTARELSQSMKEVVWSVNPHYDSLDHMSAYFRSYVAGVAENADLRFKYSADENLPAQEVNPETRRNLLLILKESISNAVKYSGCTELSLEIRWRDEKFTMKISDNGSGFDPNANDKVNSNGLRNIRQRAEASGGTVKFTSESGKGTSVEVTCPVIAKE